MTETQLDVLDLFEQSEARLHFDDGSSRSAAALAVDGRRLATWLSDNGFKPGDRIAIRLRNGIDFIHLLLACAAGGFVAVSVNTRYSDAEAADLIARSGARTIEPSPAEWADCDLAERVRRRDDPFIVLTTSGTTSRPKMVLHRQRSIADHATDAANQFGYQPSDTALAVMPLCGIFGLGSLLVAVVAGCRIIVTDFELARTAALIEAEHVTCVNGSDDMFHRLLDHGANLSSIRLGGYARFNTSLDGIVERADEAGATLVGVYGMSEVHALFTMRDPISDATERTRAGGLLASEHAAYRIVDGELQLRGPSLFAGYLAEGGDHVDDELTRRHLDDGWFRTGDLAEPNGDRSFEYIARMGDALRLGGFLVGPVEIEAVLMDDPAVHAAQVVAVDQPTGARPVGFVILAADTQSRGDASFDEATAIERCRDRLARYKVPVRVIVINDFPTTDGPNGVKIQKNKLRDIASLALAPKTP